MKDKAYKLFEKKNAYLKVLISSISLATLFALLSAFFARHHLFFSSTLMLFVILEILFVIQGVILILETIDYAKRFIHRLDINFSKHRSLENPLSPLKHQMACAICYTKQLYHTFLNLQVIRC